MRWAPWEGFEQRRDRILVLTGSLRLFVEKGLWGDEGGDEGWGDQGGIDTNEWSRQEVTGPGW